MGLGYLTPLYNIFHLRGFGDVVQFIYPVTMFLVALSVKRIATARAVPFARMIMLAAGVSFLNSIFSNTITFVGTFPLLFFWLLIPLAADILIFIGVAHLEKADPNGSFEMLKIMCIINMACSIVYYAMNIFFYDIIEITGGFGITVPETMQSSFINFYSTTNIMSNIMALLLKTLFIFGMKDAFKSGLFSGNESDSVASPLSVNTKSIVAMVCSLIVCGVLMAVLLYHSPEIAHLNSNF